MIHIPQINSLPFTATCEHLAPTTQEIEVGTSQSKAFAIEDTGVAERQSDAYTQAMRETLGRALVPENGGQGG